MADQQSVFDKCKTPRGQLIIFGILMLEMALGIYLFVFAMSDENVSHTVRKLVLFAMIDIPVVGGSILGFAAIALSKTDVKWRILKILALMTIGGFICLLIVGEADFGWNLGLQKAVDTFKIITGISAVGILAVTLKELA